MITLETAIELKKTADEFGVELPKSEFKWYTQTMPSGDNEIVSGKCDRHDYIKGHRDAIFLNAYTTDELLEWLPSSCYVRKSKKGYTAGQYVSFKSKTPSEALAQLTIYLIKERRIQ